MGRPREHSDETRARILDAASRLLAGEGVAGVSVRRVAEEAHTTTRAIYSLFGSKEGLLKQLFHDAAETMTRYHEAVPEKVDPVEEILALADAYRRSALEHPHGYDLLLNGAPGFTPDRDDTRVAQRSFARVLGAFERWGDEGRLGGREPRMVALEMWALVHGLASFELAGRLGSRRQATQRWHDAVGNAVRGFVSAKGSTRARRVRR
jgi:AcrR family transcriptional regulator